MRILGRNPSRYLTNIPEIPKYVWYLIKCVLLFKKPFRFIWAYVAATSIPGRLVELRNGFRIHLSEHPQDVVTVFVIFVREDYGPVARGNIVVDVGANIGIFALYAASHGAAKILAYEPNSASFQYLLKNVEANRWQRVIVPQQLAVASVDGATVKFPAKASMYNAILPDDADANYELVKTINLPAILNEQGHVDVLKLDCEGAEYDILFDAQAGSLDRVGAVRLEYHRGQIQELADALRAHGLVQCHLRADTATSGTLWYQRR